MPGGRGGEGGEGVESDYTYSVSCTQCVSVYNTTLYVRMCTKYVVFPLGATSEKSQVW